MATVAEESAANRPIRIFITIGPLPTFVPIVVDDDRADAVADHPRQITTAIP
jgi:hypothetical protein